MKVVRYAERIVKKEKGDPAVVLAAAYLHDIGIKEAERQYNSADSLNQEKEGPPIAREILEKLGANEELINEVCDIVGHHHSPGEDETANFKAVYDADIIANIEDNRKEGDIGAEKIEGIIEKSFLTNTGRTVARDVLLKDT